MKTKTAFKNLTHSAYRWHDMGNTPLKYPVHGDGAQGSIVVIPAGAKHVKIAFGQSWMTWYDKRAGKLKKMNVYFWNGHTWHGHA